MKKSKTEQEKQQKNKQINKNQSFHKTLFLDHHHLHSCSKHTQSQTYNYFATFGHLVHF